MGGGKQRKGGKRADAAAAGGAADPTGRPTEGEQVNPSQGTLDALAGLVDAADTAGVMEELVCAVCTHPGFKCPVQAPCEHVFHRTCIEESAAKPGSKCPVCRVDLPAGGGLKDASLPIRGMLNRAKVKCPQGCGHEVPFEQLHKHIHDEGGCPLTPLICCNGTCGASYLRRDAAAHRKSCSHAIVRCGACGQKLRRAELQSHESKINCPHCHKQGIYGCGMDAHMHTECTGAVPMHVVMRMMQEMRQELHQQQHKMHSVQHILEHTGTKIHDLVLPEPLRDLLAIEGTRHELRVEGIDCPFVLSRKDDQLFVDCSAYRGPQRLCVSVAGHSTTPLRAAAAAADQRWACRFCAHRNEQVSGACASCGTVKWACPSCRYNNGQQRANCASCGQVIPPLGPPQQGEPPVLIVASQERPQCAGRYTLLADRVNGKGVWGCGNNRIFMHGQQGQWLVVTNPAGASDAGHDAHMALFHQQGSKQALYPPQHLPLQAYRPSGAAPHSSITAEFAPQQPADGAGEALCPFAAAAEAAEVRVIILP
eukprot:TRINITY_DN459_c0_g1_i1.p1 TRINITY_DN459_c0_g1~~TRINITY_DN459_c0_g1_i1.p1  ORF type:complete len:538 (+),score=146.77 TRINITY_DN459_c0_g1_i1:93-1706(+)